MTSHKKTKFMFTILFNEFLTGSGKEGIYSFILTLPNNMRKEKKKLLWHFDILYAMMLLLWWISQAISSLGILCTKGMNDSWYFICTYIGFNNMFRLNFFFKCAQVGFTESYIRRTCTTLKMTRTELTWSELITCLEIQEFDNQVSSIVEERAGVLVT